MEITKLKCAGRTFRSYADSDHAVMCGKVSTDAVYNRLRWGKGKSR
jgi:hypothetical protein